MIPHKIHSIRLTRHKRSLNGSSLLKHFIRVLVNWKMFVFLSFLFLLTGARILDPNNPLNDFRIKYLKHKTYTTGNIEKDKFTVKIAPVFKYGSGVSVYNDEHKCSGIKLNEKSANELIQSVFLDKGIYFQSNVPEEIVPVLEKKIRKTVMKDGKETVIKETENIQLDIDGYNAQLNLGYCFIAHDDFLKFNLSSSDPNDNSHVENYYQLAEILRKTLKKSNRMNLLFFYEPVCDPSINDQMNPEEKTKIIESLLKDQISSSIKWLKDTKIINK